MGNTPGPTYGLTLDYDRQYGVVVPGSSIMTTAGGKTSMRLVAHERTIHGRPVLVSPNDSSLLNVESNDVEEPIPGAPHAELIGDVNSDRMTSEEEPDMTPRLADPVGVVDRVGVVDSMTVVMRSYLSTHHLYAARYAAEDAARREAVHFGSSVFDIGHRAYVMSAVTESIAFLEAAINEIYQDAADGHACYVGSLNQACLRLMAGLWDATDRGRMDALAKFDLALLFAGHERFDRGSAPYQDAALLVRLRNYLVHYKPEGVSSETPHKLGAALSGKFDGSAFMRDAGNPWFPDHALGAGCANWSWRSARAFTDAFASRMGLTLNYQQANFGDPLPR